MRWTSSTPASAARSSTASITRWRMSGRRIWRQRQADVVEGDGELHAREQQRRQRIAVDGFEQGAADGAVGVLDGRRAARGRRSPGSGRRGGARGGSPRRARTASAAWSGRPRGRSLDGASAPVIGSFSLVGGRRRPYGARRPGRRRRGRWRPGSRRGGRWPRRGDRGRRPARARRRGRRCGAPRRRSLPSAVRSVGVGADQAGLAVPERGEVELDLVAGMPTSDHACPAAARRPATAAIESSSRRRSRPRRRRRR